MRAEATKGLVAYAALVIVALSCSTEEQPASNNRSSNSSADQLVRTPTPGPGGGTGGSTTGGTTDGASSAGGSTGGATNLGLAFFNTTISPKFDQQCKACHSLPQNPTDVKAPLSIFSYGKMKALLSAGPAGDNNNLMNKVRALDSHGGGDRCGAAGPDASPCLEIAQWWDKEFAVGGGNIPGSTFKGRLDGVSATGEVSGYALDSANVAGTVTVLIYVDRTAGGTQPDMTVTANRIGASGGYSGNHRFLATLPNPLRDGKAHTAYVYVQTAGTPVLLVSAPLAYTAWAPTTAGTNYYNNTVQPALQARCAACHAINYTAHYASLIAPPPNMGGTVTNNDLINFPAGMNNHPGGNLCGSKTGSPCNLIQTWWTLEFGP